METDTTTESAPVTPEPIIRTMLGISAAQHLLVAGDVGLFEQLGEEALTAEELAERTGLPTRSARILADALVALQFLEKDEGRYRNGPATAAFLTGRGGADLRPYLRMIHKVLYPGWGRFDEAIRAGGGTEAELFRSSGETQRILSEGIAALTSFGAAALAGSFDFGRFGHVLDVAGGAGIHLQTVLERHPGLRGTLFELPPVAAQARERLQPLVEAGRAAVVEGDVFEDPLPRGADLVLLSHTLHLFTPDPNRRLLGRVRESVDRGSRLVLVDFWTNADRTAPVPAVLGAGEFYRMAGGDVYSVEEAQGWLAETGWQFLEHRALAGPQSLIEAEAV